MVPAHSSTSTPRPWSAFLTGEDPQVSEGVKDSRPWCLWMEWRRIGRGISHFLTGWLMICNTQNQIWESMFIMVVCSFSECLCFFLPPHSFWVWVHDGTRSCHCSIWYLVTVLPSKSKSICGEAGRERDGRGNEYSENGVKYRTTGDILRYKKGNIKAIKM